MKNITEEIKTAMKSGDKTRVTVLRGLKSAFDNAKIEAKRELTEQELIGVVRRELKKAQDTLTSLDGANRPDLALKAIDEKYILESFLPDQMSDDDIKDFIRAAIDEVGAKSKKDMGKVMKIVTSKVAGAAPGQVVSKLVQELLP